ncbi:hypothetical protein ACFSTC_20010 [Nonomuraea ferruginea]
MAHTRAGEGFRIVAVKAGDVRRLSRHVGEVKIPKVGWVRFRWSRTVPEGVKSFRVTRDRVGRWHVAFAAIPEPIPRARHGRHRRRGPGRCRLGCAVHRRDAERTHLA